MGLNGKKIIVGISGSIAAYKAVHIVRGLIKAGAEVQVLMTAAATKFITPLTLSTLSKRPVYTSATSEEGWNNHVELGLWADAFLLAPATANTIAKLANGICDSMIAAVYLSARCPVFFAPAMDLDMWAHPSTQSNVQRLQAYGNHLIDVAEGELASGLEGKGRLAEPEDIIDRLATFFREHKAVADFIDSEATTNQPGSLRGRSILITAGPTYEAIDPVRFVGNHSTGTMGVELARAAARRGARVLLVLGPSRHTVNDPMIEVIRVTSAREMYAASTSVWSEYDVAILSAAVADYRPATVSDEKIKKKDESLRLELVRNPDIAKALGEAKRPGQLVVGFAMETENGPENARRKLQDKRMSFIVLNSIGEEGAGFGEGTNRVSIITPSEELHFGLKPKARVAEDILDVLEERF